MKQAPMSNTDFYYRAERRVFRFLFNDFESII